MTERHTVLTSSRLRPLVALVLAAVLGLAGCAPASTTAPTPSAPTPSSTPVAATIGLTYIPNIQFAPFYTAADRGLYRAGGAEVTLRHHGANEGLFTALVAGEEDFVVAGGGELVQARSQGLDLVAVAQVYRDYPVALIVGEDSPITTAADLKGHSVGIPGRYGESWFGLQLLLQDAGLTTDDVDIVEIGYTAQAALATDKVDSVIGYVNNDQVQFGLAGVPTRTVPLTSGDIPLVSVVLLTTREYLEANPDVVRAVARGSVAGIEQVVADPAGAVELAKAHIPTLDQGTNAAAARATLDATLPVLTGGTGTVDGRLDPAQWAAMATFMAEHGLVEGEVDPTEAFTNEFLTS